MVNQTKKLPQRATYIVPLVLLSVLFGFLILSNIFNNGFSEAPLLFSYGLTGVTCLAVAIYLKGKKSSTAQRVFAKRSAIAVGSFIGLILVGSVIVIAVSFYILSTLE